MSPEEKDDRSNRFIEDIGNLKVFKNREEALKNQRERRKAVRLAIEQDKHRRDDEQAAKDRAAHEGD